MSYILEIPDELYASLKKVADANGTTPLAWIAAHLPRAKGTGEQEIERDSGPRTLADLFAGRVGHIHSGGKEPLSEDCGAKFTDHLEEKRCGGHL